MEQLRRQSFNIKKKINNNNKKKQVTKKKSEGAAKCSFLH